MSEITSGVRSIFSLAPVYSMAQRGIGAERFRRVIAKEYISAAAGARVVDIGSGTSDIVEHLPAVDYIGLEPSEKYAAAARNRFGTKVTIVNEGIDTFDTSPWEHSCDVVMAIGVLHHLSDEQVLSLFAAARRLLTPAGRFLAVDPCLHDDQNKIARALIVRDRGQNVRTMPATEELARQVFDAPSVALRTDLLRAPYSHVILTASTTARSCSS